MPFQSHPTAIVEDGAIIGDGTRIWHHAHVRSGAKIGRDCNVGKNVYIDAGAVVGDRVKIQNNVPVYHGVTIENDVFLGPCMVFTNDLRPRAFLWGDERLGCTIVRKGASIGANATIVCGTREMPREIGEYAMVGAGAVVTKDVPRHGLAVGNPAKLAGFACKCGERLKNGVDAGDARQFSCACGETVKIDKKTLGGML